MTSATAPMHSNNLWQDALVDFTNDTALALYIHWPYCEAKCPYCDFNSFVAKSIDHDAWLSAYLNELEKFHKLTSNKRLTSVFFGGGTPSLMRPKTVEAILAKANELWGFSNQIEITLEANPSSVEADKFRDFRLAGVNRVSVGIQALNDSDLKRLGRLHSTKEALLALDVAHSEFDRVSFDLIYGRQDQTLDQWDAELSQALKLSSGHLSLYQLTIEPNTSFGDRYAVGKLKGLPDEDLGADMYEMVQSTCESYGMHAYEVSNYAKEGHESIHNLIYWTYNDYIGIGPGAHGRLTLNDQKVATETILSPQTWLKTALDMAKETSEFTPLENFQAGQEAVLMGLRLSQGIDLNRLNKFGVSILDLPELQNLCALGLLEQIGQIVRATKTGRPLLNQILQQVLSSKA